MIIISYLQCGSTAREAGERCLLGNVVHRPWKGAGQVQKMLSLLDLSSTFPNTFPARKGAGKATFPAPFRLGKSGSMRGGRDWTRSSNPSATTDSILKRGVDPPFQIDRLKM